MKFIKSRDAYKKIELIVEADSVYADVDFNNSIVGQLVGWIGGGVIKGIKNKKLKSLITNIKKDLDNILIERIKDEPEIKNMASSLRIAVYTCVIKLVDLVNSKKTDFNNDDYTVENLEKTLSSSISILTDISENTDKMVVELGLDKIAKNFLTDFEELKKQWETLKK
jgi:hypothetical protein